ncbi:MAG: hypothetical protein RMY16_29615 [Nostoc sp. DedQUE12b]|nr:hypothetical protein [Nostoc sp. DedQUE12b]
MSTMVTEPSRTSGEAKLRKASVCDTLRERREVRATPTNQGQHLAHVT